MPSKIFIRVQLGNALHLPADILALKYAQSFYGVDELVSQRLIGAGHNIDKLQPAPGGFRLIPRVEGIAADHVLFVGVVPLREFYYEEIRAFGYKVLSSLANAAPETRHVVLTLHGPGYGLDETEAFESEVAGLLEAIQDGNVPEALERLTVIEDNPKRVRRLEAILEELVPNGVIEISAGQGSENPHSERAERLRTAGYDSGAKAHVFVAMPFRKDMDDVYHFGIQNAVRDAGFLCERADTSTFVGDILQWILDRIKSAAFLIADLSGGNPNVYLEVGYAWGCEVPTILLVRDQEQLKFDVQGQRCLKYKTIKELDERLRTELKKLKEQEKI